MVKRISLCCLALAMTGLGPPQPSAGAPTGALLRLAAMKAPEPHHGGLDPARVAEVLPAVVRYDDQGRPQSVRYRRLTSMLLAELERLDARIHRLEAELEAASRDPDAEPLVRIKVDHG